MKSLFGRMLIVVRSALVGALATVVDLVTLAALVELVGAAPRAANVPALLLGVGAQFVGNKLFAFRDHSPDWARQGLLFGLVEVGALGLNAFIFDRIMLASDAPYLVVRMLVTGLVYFCFSLPLWSMIFKPTRPTSAA